MNEDDRKQYIQNFMKNNYIFNLYNNRTKATKMRKCENCYFYPATLAENDRRCPRCLGDDTFPMFIDAESVWNVNLNTLNGRYSVSYTLLDKKHLDDCIEELKLLRKDLPDSI